MLWEEKSFGKILVDLMANDCSGPHPVNASKAYLKKVESDPYYQHELFSVLEEDIYIGDGFIKSTYYHMLPYDYAVTYVRSYEQAS